MSNGVVKYIRKSTIELNVSATYLMRKFSSYGPIDVNHNYYVPRTELIDRAHSRLVGEDPTQGGHYITIWAPRQTGKTWIMQQVVQRIHKEDKFDVAILTLQSAKELEDEAEVLSILTGALSRRFNRTLPDIKKFSEFPSLFRPSNFDRPVILILDEFDALHEMFINNMVNEFRTMHTERTNEPSKPTYEKDYILHGLALIGVRSVLGIENRSGSPFNVQQSVHIPNLTVDEVHRMFEWYAEESGQLVEPDAIEQIYYETQGQPGLVSWIGELLTTRFNENPDQPLGETELQRTMLWAMKGLPNNNVSNLISKVRVPPYDALVMDLFRTDHPMQFTYDDSETNYLYMNGVITMAEEEDDLYVKFASPFVQKRLFNFFTKQLFPHPNQLHEPLLDLSSIITESSLHVGNLVRLYEQYVHQHRAELFSGAPTRAIDGRVYEAVYHFNFFAYLSQFMQSYQGKVIPEFPTGNGKVDLLIQHAGLQFALELKSFVNRRQYEIAMQRAAEYGQQLGLSEIWLVFFIDTIDPENRQKLETDQSIQVGEEPPTSVTVRPRFVAVVDF